MSTTTMGADFLVGVGGTCIAIIACISILIKYQTNSKSPELSAVSNASKRPKKHRRGKGATRKRTKKAYPLDRDTQWVQALGGETNGIILVDINNVRGKIGFSRATVIEACLRFGNAFAPNVILEVDHGPAPDTISSSENGIVHSFAGMSYTADDLIVMDLEYFVRRRQIPRALVITSDRQLQQRCKDVVRGTGTQLRILDSRNLDRLFLNVQVSTPPGGFRKEETKDRQQQADELHRLLRNPKIAEEQAPTSRFWYSTPSESRKISSPPHWFHHYGAWVDEGRPDPKLQDIASDPRRA